MEEIEQLRGGSNFTPLEGGEYTFQGLAERCDLRLIDGAGGALEAVDRAEGGLQNFRTRTRGRFLERDKAGGKRLDMLPGLDLEGREQAPEQVVVFRGHCYTLYCSTSSLSFWPRS